MTSNISSMHQFWKNFNLPQLQRDLDINATELANRQDASDASRRRLVEQSKEFKKSTPEDVRKSVAPLLRSFQNEIDALSKRSKACEADFLNLYKKLVELPDPVVALEQAEVFQRKAHRLTDIETENQKLRDTLAEYNKEFAEVKNQEVTIKNLRERVREFEKDAENRAKQLTLEKNEQLEKQFAQKEKTLQETQLLIATKLGEAEQMAVTYKAALDASQAELFDIKSKYDEEIAAKQAELDILMGDVEKSMQRAASAEKELEQMKEKFAKETEQAHDRKKPTAMEEAIEVLSRSSLETELASKEKEISQLVEDIQHLQGSMGKLRESSASVIAKLEEELNQKNALCQELQSRIDEREDYNDIKRELEILKSTEFSTLDTSSTSDGKQELSRGGSSNAKSLEMLLLEKNRSQQSENTALRAANAQLTDDDVTTSSTPPTSTQRTNYDHQREEEPPVTPPHHRTSQSSTPNPFALNPDLSPLFESSEALNQLQLQKQQINALLNLKILASIKAAVDAQNLNSTPVRSGYPNTSRPSSSMLYNTRYTSRSPHRPGSSSQALPNSAISSYLTQLQKSLLNNVQGTSSSSGEPSPFYQRADLSDNSDEDNFYESYLKRKSRRRQFWDEGHGLNRSSEFARPRMRSSVDTDVGYPSLVDRFRRYSSGADSCSHVEEVDTEELTAQVKDLLQANNIGQRAFGQYVLGLSQGSVSEILSKPKPWSKLTFKGKEPFYKMMDFVSSPRNVEVLKSLQRKDREDRVICSGKSNTLRQSDSDSDQAIANILAAAREEMRLEQEKLKRAQKLYGLRTYSTSHASGVRSYKPRDNSSGETLIELRKTNPLSLRKRRGSSDFLESMTMMAAAGRYPHSYSSLSKDSPSMARFGSSLDSTDTDGAVEPSFEPVMSSLINRQHDTAFTGNEGTKLQKIQEDKQDSSDSQPDRAHQVSPGHSKQSEGFSGNIRIKVNSLVSGSEKTTGSVEVPNKQSVTATVVKSEPHESNEASDYFDNVEKSKGQDSLVNLNASGSSNQYSYKHSSKEDVLSNNQRLITPQENESLQRLFVTTTYNDPFIPPPLSPAGEDRSSPSQQDRQSPGAKVDQGHCYSSPFMDDDSVPSHFMSENSKGDNSLSSDRQKTKISERRKRVISLSPPSRHSGGLLSEPVLFKELSCPPFHDSDRKNFPDSDSVSSTVPSTFSGMLSTNHTTMSSLQTTSNNSMYNAQVSYTELNPVTTGSLFGSHRDVTEQDYHRSTSNGYTSVDGSQNGIASMLPPLGLKTSSRDTGPLPTFSTLTNSVPSSKYSELSPESHVKHMQGSYEDDQMMETSTLTTPVPPEALHQLSMTHVDTAMLTKEVRDRLAKHSICQRTFGERILGLSQGTVSDILSHPKPWNKLTHKGREPFARMIMWLADTTAGGLLHTARDRTQIGGNNVENITNSPTSDGSTCPDPVNLSKDQSGVIKNHSPTSNGTSESGGHFVSLSPVPASTAAHSPHTSTTLDHVSHDSRSIHLLQGGNDAGAGMDTHPAFSDSDRQRNSSSGPDQGSGGPPVTPLQQMLNIQELAASCPKLDTFALTRKVKDILTEHNIGQRIFGQAVLGLTQGSVSDLLSRPKLWRSLSLKGREPFVRMQLWLSDPNNVEQLKSLKLERWMEKKWAGNKRQRSSENSQHSLSPVKKQRIVLSTEEKEVLRKAYAIEPYPSQETVDLLAMKLGRKSSTIVNWFHNYRSRVKRGFFPGEEIQENVEKKGGAKVTVKQLLDTITLTNSGPGHHTNRNTFSSAGSLKSTHSSSGSSSRRHSNKVSEQVSWGQPQVPSPPTFDRYNSMEHMKTETMDQHFQNLHQSEADNMYTGNIMHSIKQEAKLMPIHSEHNSSMYSPSYPYPMRSTTSVSDMFKAAEMSLDTDPVAMAAATSFIQPKTSHHSNQFAYSQPLDDHHDTYALSTLSNENSYPKGLTAASSPHSNSFLPPVHTLAPKKSFGSPSSHSILPSASSLLNPPHLNQPHLDKSNNVVPYCNTRPMPHLVSLGRPHYDNMVGNNNMNNNSGPSTVKNVTLPGGVSLTVSGTQRLAQSEGENKESIPTTVWVNSPVDSKTQTTESVIAMATTDNRPQDTAAASENQEGGQCDLTNDPSGKEKEDDSYAWVF